MADDSQGGSGGNRSNPFLDSNGAPNPFVGTPVSGYTDYGNPIPFTPGQTLDQTSAGRALGDNGGMPFYYSALGNFYNGLNTGYSSPIRQYMDKFLNQNTLNPLYTLLQGGKETSDQAGVNAQSFFDNLIGGMGSVGGNTTSNGVMSQILTALQNPTGRLQTMFDGSNGLTSDQLKSLISNALQGAVGISTADPYQQAAEMNQIRAKMADYAGSNTAEDFRNWLVNSGLLQFLSGH